MKKALHQKKWSVFVLVAFGVFMSTLDGSIVNIALPAILDDFDTKLSVVEWVVMIYLLTVTSFLLGCGKLSDIYGHKRIYIIGLGLFTLSSLSCALAPDIILLIISRMIQGFASAMIMACTPALLVSAFPASERGKIFGINGMVVACGLTIGPAIGGLLIHEYSWPMIFYINIPVGIIAVTGSCIVLEENPTDTEKIHFDYVGMISAALGIGLFLVAITHGYEWGINSVKLIGTSVLSIVFMLVFIINEIKIPYPVLNLSIFKNRMLIISSVSGVLLFLILFVMIFLMPFFLMKARGLDAKSTGYIMMIPFAFLFIVSPISGNISDYLGSRILCSFGMFLVFLGIFLLGQIHINEPVLSVGLKLSLVGIGTAIFISPNSAALMSSIPYDFRGTGGAIMATARNLGMVLGIAFAGSLFNTIFYSTSGSVSLNNYSPEMNKAFMEAFHFTMKTTSVIALLATIITALRGREITRQRRI